MLLPLLALVGCKSGEPVPIVCDACDEVGPSARFSRLTHTQWENAVRDLLALDARPGLSQAFIGDLLSEGGFDNDADALSVSPELWSDYQRAAEQLAAQIVTDRDAYARVVPEDSLGSVPVGDPIRVEAESSDAEPTVGAEFGDGWMVWANGELRADFDLPAGEYELVGRVWATQAGPDLAEAEIRLDGATLGSFEVAAETEGSAQEIAVVASVSGGVHTVAIAFTNDYTDGSGDRNLIVDWVEVRPVPQGLPATDAERDAWIARFGRRAHRRPLTAEDTALYTQLFDAGAAMELTGDPFKDGVYTTLTAFLQSPHFVYRTELGEAPDENGRIPLDEYELASKLSFSLWNTMPDDALLDAAEAGEISADLRGRALAMLDDPRAQATVDHFHHQLLNLDAYANIFKDDAAFPDWSPVMNDLMAEEARQYARHAVIDGDSVFGFYTAPATFVNRDLAPIYGVSSTSDSFERVELDPSQRAGILTTSGFLSLNAQARDIDSIHRGVFVNLRLLCSNLPPPPAMVPPLPPPEPGLSNRERVDRHTGPGTCGAGCHSTLINPVGFAFENYDAIGQWRDDDAGLPIDASGTFEFLDVRRTWQTPIGFAAAMGDSYDAHACLVRNWMRFTHGREPTPEDERLIARLAVRSTQEDAPIRDLVLELVSTDAFRFRNPEGATQ
ncbi:MAG: DUF1592 domain-containing protein [Alphaproteobacteria bacterium]|nr:DUF1592 domain-containing protein [Alphaproteobacteria bacterium]